MKETKINISIHIILKLNFNYLILHIVQINYSEMKALFLVFHGFEAHNGISKKIFYQIDGLKQCGVDARLSYLFIDEDGYHKRMADETVIENFGKGVLAKIKKRIYYDSLLKYILQEEIEFVYVRHDLNANPFLVSLFKSLKKNNIKIILEIPTYPYDQEFIHADWKECFQNKIDKLFRMSLAKTLFRIVTFTDLSVIWGVPTINISNGIDFNKVRIKATDCISKDKLNMIGVADIHAWHGYDRVIKGLANYYQQNNQVKVYFHIVGEGIKQLVNELKLIVKQNQLEEYVQFHGPKSGLELDVFFDFSDFGIASLARHRSNITNIKTLKNREYAARGIPFIYSETDTDFDNMPYIIKAPANETPINIQSIVDFHSKLTISAQDIRLSINHLSWKNQMNAVINNITNTKTTL